MKKIILFASLSLPMISCNQAAEEVNKRENSALTEADAIVGSGDNNAIDVVTEEELVNFSGVSLLPAANLDQYPAESLAALQLVSKINSEQTVVFGGDGQSWLYGGPDSAGLEAIEPAISGLQGRTRYVLPEGDFWVVDAETVSKRKAAADPEQENRIVMFNFDLTALAGSRDNLRVLGITHEALILHMGSHVGVLEVKDDLASAYEFEIKLPGAAAGSILSAGAIEQGGYWFLTDSSNFALLTQKEGAWTWSVVSLPMTNSEGNLKAAALWLDSAAQSAAGDAAILTDLGLYSITGAPIAAPAVAPPEEED